VTKQPTQSLKKKRVLIIIQRDYKSGEKPYCFYCGAGFVFNHKYFRRVWEHLNNDDEDWRPENLVWAHWLCNEEKKNNIEYLVRAEEKLKENVIWIQSRGVRESEREKYTHVDTEELSDAEVGKKTDKITKTFLDEHLKGENKKEFLMRADTRACITYLVKQETNGRGSHQATDRAIDDYCCTIADYVSKKEDGKRIIRLRKQWEGIF